ncbi:hypothetical protein [Phaeobacter sp. 22II1-1F12B]|uniref:hypothetical protein n=1 Tax=Phaeobacter sp. 22II1-1F12B TaxID=1317111 RepID=UPI000B528D49|nr:hypothetical protein [Phaeobacter sp. 22II1-1F12B]OWU77104.1 hypothetical protein ATO1_15775 [Phaeobacter sp. 22II1-1F12B]
MTEKIARAKVAEYEKLALLALQRIAARKKLPNALSSEKMKKLDTALGDADKVMAFLTSMPKLPGAEEILDAFKDAPEKLGALVNGPFAGDMGLLAALADRGCNRDPDKLLVLASADATDLKLLLGDCGLAAYPEAFAALYQDGCGAAPDGLKKLATNFAKEDDRKKLVGALENGGLGFAPEALAALAKGDDGKLLLKLVQDMGDPAGQKVLQALLADGGMDGQPPGRPGLLADIFRDGLGQDAGKLKSLHTAFCPNPPPAKNDLSQLAGLVRALDGGDDGGAARMKKVLDRVKPRLGPPAPSEGGALKHYGDTINSMGRAAGAPAMAEGTAQRAAAVVADRADPAVERVSVLLAATLDLDRAAEVLGATLGDAAPQLAEIVESASAQAGLAELLSKEAASGDADQEITDATAKATKAVTDAETALLAQGDRAALKDITALGGLIDTLLDQVAVEPDDTTRKAALKAVETGSAAIRTAMTEQAGTALAGAGPAAAATAQLARVAELRKGAGEAELAQLGALQDAVAKAAVAAVGAGADPDKSAAAATKAVEEAFAEDKRKAERDRRDEEAKTAAAEALALCDRIEHATPPISAKELAMASAKAAEAADAGRAACDKTQAKAALDAAKALSEAIAKAGKRASGLSETAAIYGSVEGKKALHAAGNCDQVQALLNASSTGSVMATQAETAAKAARASGLTLAEVERLLAASENDLREAAEQAATAKAAADKGDIPESTDVDAAKDAANKAAEAARKASDTKRKALAALDVTVDSAAYATAITEAREAADKAMALALLASDDVIRKAALGEAQTAMKTVATACDKLATHLAGQALTALEADQASASDTARASLDALRGPADAAKLKTAAANVSLARDAINATGKARLSALVQSDSDVSDARDAAMEAQAKAQVPGAARMAKLEALIAAAAADKAVAQKIGAVFTADIAAIPAKPASNTDPWPGGDPAKAMRKAISSCEAKATAGAKWLESAKAVLDAIRAYEAEFKALGTLSDPGEKQELDALTAKKAAAEDLKKDAVDFQKTHDNSGGLDLRDLFNLLKNWTKWAHQKDKNGARTKAIKNANGFVKAMTAEGLRTSGGASFTPASRDELVRIGATLENDPYTGTPLEAIALGGGEPAHVDMEHICGRHVRESYAYGQKDGGPLPDDQIVGRMLEGKYEGNLTGGDAPDPEENRLIRQGKSDKPNSLLPEGVTKTNMLALGTEVMKELRKAAIAAGKASLKDYVTAAPDTFLTGSIDIDTPLKCKVTYGVNLTGTGEAQLRMLHAKKGDSLMMPDMIAMGKAIGL